MRRLGFRIYFCLVPELISSNNLSRSKLFLFHKEIGIGTSRKKLIHPEDQEQMVLDELAKDPLHRLGPHMIRENLALQGKHITR